MFESFDDLMEQLKATGYFIDPVMTRIVFLAAKLQKPLLLEGPAGSGKTQLAVSVAQAAGTHIERLQCYRGVTEDKAIGRFDESLQRLYIEFSKGNGESGRRVARAHRMAQPGWLSTDRRNPSRLCQEGRTNLRRGRTAHPLMGGSGVRPEEVSHRSRRA